MLHTIDMLTAAALQHGIREPPSFSLADDIKPLNDIQAEAEHSRSPLTMTRAAVRADLTEMMRYFGAEPEQLRLYRDELGEAENLCARCQHVGRCRRWRANRRHGDAPRLFCTNVDFFEELTPDPFWTATAPGEWHHDAALSPLLRLLAKTSPNISDDLPDLRANKLDAFVNAAADVDALIDEWGSKIGPASPGQDVDRLCEQCSSAIRLAIDHADGITTDEFRHILQVALCDRELAQELCRLLNEHRGGLERDRYQGTDWCEIA